MLVLIATNELQGTSPDDYSFTDVVRFGRTGCL